jgi:hypothetical protein
MKEEKMLRGLKRRRINWKRTKAGKIGGLNNKEGRLGPWLLAFTNFPYSAHFLSSDRNLTVYILNSIFYILN